MMAACVPGKCSEHDAAAPAPARPAATAPVSPLGTFAAREATEAIILAGCTARDFEVLERLGLPVGGGASGNVFMVRCLAADHPFPHKLYALKVVKNYDNLTSQGLRIRYEAEFDLLEATDPDPFIVGHWVKFVDTVPEAMIALMGEVDQDIIREHNRLARTPADWVLSMMALFDYHPQTLSEWLKAFRVAGPAVLPLAEFVPKARQVMCAFRLLEERNILHRDVKTNNILVKEDGCVCICDFGDACSTAPDGTMVLRIPNNFAKGNTAHQAPEVMDALHAFHTDPMLEATLVDYSGQAVFEVGVLLWEMAVGVHPVVAGYPSRCTYPPAAVCVIDPLLQAQLDAALYPPEFVGLVRRMVALDAGARPSLAAALQQFQILFDPAFAALQAELDAALAAVANEEALKAAAVAQAAAAEAALEAATLAKVAAEYARDVAIARATAAETALALTPPCESSGWMYRCIAAAELERDEAIRRAVAAEADCADALAAKAAAEEQAAKARAEAREVPEALERNEAAESESDADSDSEEEGQHKLKVVGAARAATPSAKEQPGTVPGATEKEIMIEMKVISARFPPILSDSSILGGMEPMEAPNAANVAAFQKMMAGWLVKGAPNITPVTYPLYHGRQADKNLNPAAFHAACDGKGPTITLIRSEEGYVFGGYSGASWSSPDSPHAIKADSFLFSVTGPHGNLTYFPARNDGSPGADGKGSVWRHSKRGPCFGSGDDDGIVLRNSAWLIGVETAAFDKKSRCGLPASYLDTLGKGDATFTGSATFTPVEVEVWRVSCADLPCSAILSKVDPARFIALQQQLTTWLPDRSYRLLYRGSRDGMTARDFHIRCDDQGPTLVLVRCDKGWVFGGYANASWTSPLPNMTEYFASDTDLGPGGTPFLFSVTGPHTKAPANAGTSSLPPVPRFSVTAANAATACCTRVDSGPGFNEGLYLWAPFGSESESPIGTALAGAGGTRSYCQVGVGYEDSIGYRDASLTGASEFAAVEVEVYAVAPA